MLPCPPRQTGFVELFCTIPANPSAQQCHHRPGYPSCIQASRLQVLFGLHGDQPVECGGLLLLVPRDERQDARGDWWVIVRLLRRQLTHRPALWRRHGPVCSSPRLAKREAPRVGKAGDRHCGAFGLACMSRKQGGSHPAQLSQRGYSGSQNRGASVSKASSFAIGS